MASTVYETLKNIEYGKRNCIKNAKIANLPATDDMSIWDIGQLFLQQNNAENLNPNNPEQGGGWIRPADWWDTKTILQNAEIKDGLYPAYIILLANDSATTTFTKSGSAVALQGDGYLTSDGTWYVDATTPNPTHTWDETQDKECSAGYKTRYVIVYVADRENIGQIKISDDLPILEFISGDMTIGTNGLVFNSTNTVSSSNNANNSLMNIEFLENTIVKNGTLIGVLNCYAMTAYCLNLKSITMPQVTTISGGSTFSNCYSLVSVSLPALTTISGGSTFSYCYSLVSVSLPALTTISGGSTFSNCYSLAEFSFLSTYEDINLQNIFQNCYFLKNVELFSGWNWSGLDVSAGSLTVESLRNMLNALGTVTSTEEQTYTLTLGDINLSKLTEEEKAIATNKGWVLA